MTIDFWVGVNTIMVLLIFGYCLVLLKNLVLDPLNRLRGLPALHFGIVYVIQRSDGLLKFGYSTDLRSRLHSHIAAYKQSCVVLCAWPVLDVRAYERRALWLTRAYAAGGELRRMSTQELSDFVLIYTEEVANGFKTTQA